MSKPPQIISDMATQANRIGSAGRDPAAAWREAAVLGSWFIGFGLAISIVCLLARPIVSLRPRANRR